MFSLAAHTGERWWPCLAAQIARRHRPIDRCIPDHLSDPPSLLDPFFYDFLGGADVVC